MVLLVAQGHLAEGFARLEQARRQCVDSNHRYFACRVQSVLGSVYLEIARRKGGGGLLAALKQAGVVIKHVLPAAKKAQVHLERAITMAEEIGARAVLGMALFDMGRLCQTTRRPGPARKYFSRAIEEFEHCGATIRLEQAKQELARLESSG